jgi:hypothetical protein
MARQTSRLKITLTIFNVLLLIGLAGAAVYLYIDNQDLKEVLSLSTEEKNARLVEEINKVYDLPDEVPVVAVVADPEQFKSQYPFFDNAESGDYLLFYRKARLNVLYRQDEKRVVKTADVVVPISVEVIGSQDAIAVAEEKLKQFGEQITIVQTVKVGMTQSFVFDVDDDQKAIAESIATQLGLEIGSTLPSSITPAELTEVVIVVTDLEPTTNE